MQSFLLLFCGILILKNVQTTEFIYPAAPFLARRAGSNETAVAKEVKGCDCAQLEIVTTSEAVRRKHGELLGKNYETLVLSFCLGFALFSGVFDKGFFGPKRIIFGQNQS